VPQFAKDGGGPAIGDVHVNGPDWKPRPKKDPKKPANLGGTPGLATEGAMEGSRPAVIGKGEPQPLYVYRPVVNAAEIIAWAKKAGFDTTLTADDMHVTIAYSKAPVDWMAFGESYTCDPKGQVIVKPGGPRQLANFGPDGQASVLLFASNDLSWRHAQICDGGASWDWDGYSPHITISYQGDSSTGVDQPRDLSGIEPYQGQIILGPEVFEPLTEGWGDSIVEKSFESFFKVSGVDQNLGLVFGWGIVCKEGGEDYYDTQKNHVPEDAMVEATTDFMKSARVHGDMHVRGTGPEVPAGMVVHSFPLTTEIAKAMGIDTTKTGWMVATAPDAAMLAKFASGEYTGFSIGGDYIEIDGKPVGAAQ
jgi:Putative phage serine protease XkdF